MKKNQRAMRDFEKLKAQLPQTRNIVRHSKSAALWNHEASVRKKLKALGQLRRHGLRGFESVYSGWMSLLDEISVRLLAVYNKKNGSAYQFEDIVEKNREGYLSSGIIAVLTAVHIPDLVAAQFKAYFPKDPKDEYPKARTMERFVHLHLGDTNTGKTYNAIQRLKQAKHGVYLAPLRILAMEVCERLNQEGVPCSLITGEEEILAEGARHVSSTVEKLQLDQEYDVAVIDEIQMIGNAQRGQAWTRALLGLRCREIHLCGARNAKDLLLRILTFCGDRFDLLEYTRQTPLEIYESPYNLCDLEPGDALVVFSRQRALELSKLLADRGVRASMIYGDLPPEVRRKQYALFTSGQTDVLVTTDAIGMGVNLPIRRIIFMSMQKFDGEEVRLLTSQELKQIGGRAGRQGIYEVGYVGSAGLDQAFLRESLDSPDEPVTQAVTGPSEAILKVGSLPLSQKLALWSMRHVSAPDYKKMDIRDFLLLLEAVRPFCLPEEIQYRLMLLPFDVHSEALLDYLLDCVEDCFIQNGAQIGRPQCPEQTLSGLELYYQMLNLYYSFSKAFGLVFDDRWVYRERERLSEQINALLLRL